MENIKSLYKKQNDLFEAVNEKQHQRQYYLRF